MVNELALFAGAGGGILGGHLLGWRTVCAVEWEPYPASVLCARQNDGFLPPFPIWDDVQTFDGKPWRGIVDVVSGGFPCQDISVAGGGLALTESAAGCGEKWRASFTKYSPDLRLWKTHQCSLLGDLEPFLETWPQWGLMRNGECWEQRTLGLVTIEKEFGYWPTPTATDWKATGKLETLKRQGDKNGAGHQNRPQYQYARKYNMKMPLAAQEILMKWPLGWTDLKPLAMDKSHCAPQPLGIC